MICQLCSTSLSTGIIPNDWMKGTITVIPKDGNWHPLTQTSVFAKLSGRLVHARHIIIFIFPK